MKIILVILISFAAAVRGQCDLDCEQNAPCVEGAANFSDHPTYSDGTPLEIHQEDMGSDGKHCACPHGWTGLTCDRVFTSCDGSHKCYNGGKCIPGLKDYYNNEQLYCDCSEALAEDGIPYTGKYCEHVSREACTNHGGYCVNGGECNPSYPDSGPPCNCPNGFAGASCEFRANEIPECTLECDNGGMCQLGLHVPFNDLDHLYLTNTSNPEDFMHCVCPEGYGGKTCSIPTDQCGEFHCYHGGTCLSRIDDKGVTKHHCDCTSADTTTASFAGRFCQYESTSFCSKSENQNGNLFCVNNGECLGDGVQGCACEDPFYGPSCEFKHLPKADQTDEDPNTIVDSPPGEDSAAVIAPADSGPEVPLTPEECTLSCDNGGTCRYGIKDLGVLSDVAPYVAELNQTADENFMHCVCPEGWVGLRCEHKIEVCLQGTHVCLYGSKCVSYGDEQSCNCAESSMMVVGSSCEHKSTMMCTQGPLLPSQPRLFCVNQGTCKNMVAATEPHPGCDCVGDWTGLHCEIPKSVSGNVVNSSQIPEVSPPNADPEAAKAPMVVAYTGSAGASSAVLIIGILALLSSVMVFAVTWMRHRNHRRKIEQDEARRNLTFAIASRGTYTDNPSLASALALKSGAVANDKMFTKEPEVYVGPPRDEDGHELHTLEIT